MFQFEDMHIFILLMIVVFGVILPSADVYSDIAFDVRLFVGGYYHNEWCRIHFPKIRVEPQPTFGAVMLMPVLLSWLFATVQWYRLERGVAQKLKTIPLVILQFYPQWRAIRIIYYAKWKRDPGWVRMKEQFDTDIGTLGA